jgi:8-oxo-dGTP diphosphatase
MHQLTIINPENVSEEDAKSYSAREAARAVVIDSDNMIALLHVSKSGYYKLPGGGLEGVEDPRVALDRECQEEIGCDVEVIAEIGSIVEYRKMFTLKQTSYCYLAKVKGEKRAPAFTSEEIEKGFEAMWLPYEKVLELMKQSSTSNIEGSAYIVPRDTAFLETAKEYLNDL